MYVTLFLHTIVKGAGNSVRKAMEISLLNAKYLSIMSEHGKSASDAAVTLVNDDQHGPYYIHTSVSITDPSDLLQFARPGYKRVVHLTPRLRGHTDLTEAVAFKAFVEGELRNEDPPNPESVYVLTGFDGLIESDYGLRRRISEVHK